MAQRRFSFDGGESRWTLPVPQAQGKLPLNFVLSQTSRIGSAPDTGDRAAPSSSYYADFKNTL